MAKQPEKKKPAASKTKPAPKIDPRAFDENDVDGEMDADTFDLENSMDTIRHAYLHDTQPDPVMAGKIERLEGQVKDYVGAIKTAGGNPRDPNVIRTKQRLAESLEELAEDDPATASRAVNVIFADVRTGLDLDETPAISKKPALNAHDITLKIERAAATTIESVRDSHASTDHADTQTYDALTELASKLREGRPSKPIEQLLEFIAEAAIVKKLPQQHNPTQYARLTHAASENITRDGELGAEMVRRVMNDGILAAATSVTSPMITRK